MHACSSINLLQRKPSIALKQSTAVPVVSTSMEEFEYKRFDLFYLTGYKVSFFAALLTFGPYNCCGKKKSRTIFMAKFLLKVDFNCSEGGSPLWIRRQQMPVWSFTTDPFERELIFRSSKFKPNEWLASTCSSKYHPLSVGADYWAQRVEILSFHFVGLTSQRV